MRVGGPLTCPTEPQERTPARTPERDSNPRHTPLQHENGRCFPVRATRTTDDHSETIHTQTIYTRRVDLLVGTMQQGQRQNRAGRRCPLRLLSKRHSLSLSLAELETKLVWSTFITEAGTIMWTTSIFRRLGRPTLCTELVRKMELKKSFVDLILTSFCRLVSELPEVEYGIAKTRQMSLFK